MDDMRIGFTMHPRWAGVSGLKPFLEPLRQAGLAVLEFELDFHLDLWNEFEPLMEAAASEGMELSFHAPYRAPYTLTGFSGSARPAIETDYRPMLAIAENWAIRTGSPRVVVFHAAVAPLPHDRQALIDDTVLFLNWVYDEFPHIRAAIENNNPASNNMLKVGIKREDVIQLVETVNHPNWGICWDMGHDYLQEDSGELEEAWLSRVIHVHLHDVDAQGLDHYPLIFGNVPYPRWLGALKTAGMGGIIVLELKGERMMGLPLDRIQSTLTRSIAAIASEVV